MRWERFTASEIRCGVGACVLAVTIGPAIHATAHFPHDPMAEVSTSNDGAGLVAQYLYPDRRLVVASDDSGRSWAYAAPQASKEVWLTLEHASGSVVFAADGVNSTAFRSDDGGLTWTPTAEPDGSPVHCVIPSPAYDDEPSLWAGTQTGLQRSVDAGASWYPTALGVAPVNLVDLSPAFPQDPWLVALAGGIVWTSPDGADSWEPRLEGVDPTAVTLSPGFDSDDRLWIGTRNGGVWASADRGLTWEDVQVEVPGVGPLDDPIHDILALGPDRLLAVTSQYAALCSDDAGRTWGLCSAGLPAPGEQQSSMWGHYRRLDASGSEAGAILASWEGVMASDDGGERWRERCAVLPTYERSVAFSPAYPDDPTLWIGSYGSGLYVTHDGGVTWDVVDGLATHLFIEEVVVSPGYPSDPRLLLIASRRLMLSEDGGSAFEHVELPDTELLHQLELSAQFGADGTVYAVGTTEDEGRWAVARSDDWGRSWETTHLADPPPGPQIRLVRASPTRSGTLYGVQSEPAAVLASSDGGHEWETLLDAATAEFATLFALHSDGADALVAVTAEGDVWHGGADPDSWQAAGGLGSGVVSGDVVAPAAGESPTLLLFLDPPGLARSTDGGETWERVPAPFGSILLTAAMPPAGAGDPTLVASTHYGSFFTCDDGETWSLLDRLLRFEDEACSLGYSGHGWTTLEGQGSGGSSLRSATAGDAVELTFWGRGVRWIAARGPQLGTASVQVDGEHAADVDLQSDDAVESWPVFERGFDDDGFHTLRIEVAQGAVVIDAVDVVRHTVQNGPVETYVTGPWCVDLPAWREEDAGGCDCSPSPIEVETSGLAIATLGLATLARRRRGRTP